MSIPPGGLGPWFCTLYFNASQSKKCKKQTFIIACSMPHLALDALNVGSAELRASRQADGECWVMILKIGPFERWNDAQRFMAAWTAQTRGKGRRIDRGMELFHSYRERYKLQAWGQFRTRNECVDAFFDDAAHNRDSPDDLLTENGASLSAFEMLDTMHDVYNASHRASSIFGLRQVHDTLSVAPASAKKIKTSH